MVDTPDTPATPLAGPTPPATPEVPKDVLRRRNAEQAAYIAKVNEQLAVITRIATLAVARLADTGSPGTMRITEEQWAGAEGGDLQWRTVRLPGLEPEIHVACTLQGEVVEGGAPGVNGAN